MVIRNHRDRRRESTGGRQMNRVQGTQTHGREVSSSGQDIRVDIDENYGVDERLGDRDAAAGQTMGGPEKFGARQCAR